MFYFIICDLFYILPFSLDVSVSLKINFQFFEANLGDEDDEYDERCGKIFHINKEGKQRILGYQEMINYCWLRIREIDSKFNRRQKKMNVMELQEMTQ